MDFHYDPIPLPHRQNLSDDESLTEATAYYEFIKQRHTIRDFTDQPVSRDVIETCLRAAGTAPSGANHQPWHFACVSDPDTKKKSGRRQMLKKENSMVARLATNGWMI